MKKIKLTKRQKNNFLRKNRNSKDVTGYKTYIGIVFKDYKENFFLKKGRNFVFIGKNISKIEIAEDNSKRKIFKIYNQEGFYILYNKKTKNFSSWEYPIEKVEIIKTKNLLLKNLLFIITKKGNKYLLEKDEMSILERKLPMDTEINEYDERSKILIMYSKEENRYIHYNGKKYPIEYVSKHHITGNVYILNNKQNLESGLGDKIVNLKTGEFFIPNYLGAIESVNHYAGKWYIVKIIRQYNNTRFEIFNIKKLSIGGYINKKHIDLYDKREFLGRNKMYNYILLSNSKNGNKKFLKIKENLYFENKFLGREIYGIGKLKRNIFGKVTIKCFSESGSYATFNFNKMKLSNWKF